VAGETLDALGLTAADARRNVVTRGVDLDALIGRRFRVGEVECVGRRRCEPCAHLQRISKPGILRALVHRGGLRADVLAGGAIRIGDRVEPA
jgi:MOSC domain-containing protein YiiM